VIYVLRRIFPNELKHICAQDIVRIGKSVIFLNLLFKKLFRNYNSKFMIHFTSRVILPDAIKIIGNCPKVLTSFAVSHGSYFQAYNGIIFDRGSKFGPNVKFISSNHSLDDRSKHENNDPIYVGKNCWVGAGAIILPGVSLGDNSVIGAGSVVTKSVEVDTVVAGNPAKILRKLTS
jgi:serine acetyltransferase